MRPVLRDDDRAPASDAGHVLPAAVDWLLRGHRFERGIACRTADSLALRGFLGLGLDQVPPEHSTISRTRRLIDLETHRAVFTWILQVLATANLVRGKTIGIDATTLGAIAALRSIVRRDSGETYQEFLTRLAQASASRRRRGPTWRGSIGSARRQAAIRSGGIPTILTHVSPR